MSGEPPKSFISYSWTSPEHQEWVLRFATELRESGVDVILDKWDLKEGHDANAFMEKMVTDPAVGKVILVCDERYVTKADARAGGVGTEAQIISPALYAKTEQTKFVAVIKEVNADGKPFTPAYYGSRIYIDLSSDELYAQNFDQVLRWVYDKPLHIKPSIGAAPAFLAASESASLGNAAAYRRAVESIRASRPNAKGALEEYFDSCISGIERFRITSSGAVDFDDRVLESIELFTPHRNELIDLFIVIAQYMDEPGARQSVQRFFERLIPLMHVPASARSFRDVDSDNCKFIVHELFLSLMAVLLRQECFDFAAHMMRSRYYVPALRDSAKSHSFLVFRSDLNSLGARNQRLGLRRLSLRADLLRDRCKGTSLQFRHLAQADFVLFLRSSIDVMNPGEGHLGRWRWWPETLLFVHDYDGACEIFARAESRSYFDRMKIVFDAASKDALKPVFDAFAGKYARDKAGPKWQTAHRVTGRE